MRHLRTVPLPPALPRPLKEEEMATDSLEFQVEAKCERCDATLEATVSVETDWRGKPSLAITVEPCDDCLNTELETGQKEGAADPDAYQ